MTPQDITKAELAMLAWREGHRYGGVSNMLAVALVVRNRVRSGWLGGDWMRVIAGHNQWHAGDFNPALRITWPVAVPDDVTNHIPDWHSPQVRGLLEKIDSVFDGTMPDALTEGSLYYAELSRVDHEFNGDWFTKNILQNPEEHQRVATIGVVSFFT